MERNTTTLLISLLFAAPLLAPAQVAPKWTSATGAVEWLRTTNAGALVACTPEGLKGIDAATGTVSWTLKALADAPEDGFSEVDGTPFITVVPANAPEALNIVEPFTGTVVFDSREAGMQRIVSTYFLYANNAIILTGQGVDKKAMMACVDMGTAKVRWTKDDSFSRLTACVSAGPDAILLSTLFFTYKLDAGTGAELWKQSPDPKFASMAGLFGALDKGGANLGADMQPKGLFVTTKDAPDLCFMVLQQTKKSEKTDSQGKTTTTMSYTTFINAFRIADGSYAWGKPVQLMQQLGTIVPLKQGLLVGAADNGDVQMLAYASGEGQWGKNGKGIKVKGALNGALAVGDRVLLTSGGDKGTAELVDASGTELWKKPVKLDGTIDHVVLLNNGLVIASKEEMEVVDLSTGNSVLERTFQGGSGLVARQGADVYMLNTKDGLLYKVTASGATAISTVPLEFSGKEKPARLEATSTGYVVSSDQNVALIGPGGSIVYNKYIPAPRASGLVRALNYANAVRAAYYTAAFGYTSAAFGAVSNSITVQDAGSAVAKDITGQVGDLYAGASEMALSATKQFLQAAQARFKATASTADVQFMLGEEGKGSYALNAVKKSDGSALGTITLGNDKTPKYEVDGFSGTVYLADKGSVKAFAF